MRLTTIFLFLSMSFAIPHRNGSQTVIPDDFIRESTRILHAHEGYETHPYTDTVGKITIGIGHNLSDNGIPPHIIKALFHHDLQIAVADVIQVFGEDLWQSWTRARQVALTDMMFNLGRARFLTFKNMIQAVTEGHWEEAASEALDSKWSRQVGMSRAGKVAFMLKTGDFRHESQQQA